MFADLYPTPREATEALLAVEDFEGPVWESASGLGHISKVLIQRGYQVWSTDLHARRYGFGEPLDFLEPLREKTVQPGWNIVTNPPYSRSREFLRRGLELKPEKLALFLPFECMRVQSFVKICEEFYFPTVHLLFPTLVIEMKNGKQKSGFYHAWYVWDRKEGWKKRSFEVRPLYWKEI